MNALPTNLAVFAELRAQTVRRGAYPAAEGRRKVGSVGKRGGSVRRMRHEYNMRARQGESVRDLVFFFTFLVVWLMKT